MKCVVELAHATAWPLGWSSHPLLCFLQAETGAINSELLHSSVLSSAEVCQEAECGLVHGGGTVWALPIPFPWQKSSVGVLWS